MRSYRKHDDDCALLTLNVECQDRDIPRDVHDAHKEMISAVLMGLYITIEWFDDYKGLSRTDGHSVRANFNPEYGGFRYYEATPEFRQGCSPSQFKHGIPDPP